MIIFKRNNFVTLFSMIVCLLIFNEGKAINEQITTNTIIENNIQTTIATDTIATNNFQTTIATDTVTANNVQTTIATDTATANNVQTTIATDTATANNVQTTIATDTVATNNFQTTIATDTVATNNFQTTIATDTIAENNVHTIATNASVKKSVPANTATDIIVEKKPKITLLLKGGLGNQLFQYATAYTIAKHNNYEVLIDISSYVNYKYNEICGYVLADILPDIKTKKLKRHDKIANALKPIGNWFKRGSYKIKNIYSVKENFFYDNEINNINPDTYIEGDFFNCNYFTDYSDEIIKMFSNLTLSKIGLSIANNIKQEEAPTVAIHYRDYSDIKAGGSTSKNYYGILDIDYYLNAIKIIREQFKIAKFYVFSNNIINAKKVLATIEDLEFIDYTQDNIWEDMKLMSLCNHNIIANSSYSYWAAYLNTNQNKIVIAPQQFFLWQKDDNNDFCPDDWIKIESHFQKKK